MNKNFLYALLSIALLIAAGFAVNAQTPATTEATTEYDPAIATGDEAVAPETGVETDMEENEDSFAAPETEFDSETTDETNPQ
ncbi:MAG: hypothetical protein AB7U85_06955 [Alphaproteobacteria bacterium]